MALTLAITGGTGFVGGHSIAEAMKRGHRVRALARRPQPARPGLEWVAGSLTDGDALENLVSGADAVLHIAGVTNADGRVTIMMPHPERVYRTAQRSWHPDDWKDSELSGWYRLFAGARKALG